MRRTLTLFSLILLVPLGLAVSGCGGGSDKTAAPATTEATVAATTEAATTEAATTEATPTTTPTTTSSNLGGIASSKNCRELAGVGQKFASAFTGATNSQNLKKEAQLLKDFAAKTPSAIRADFNVLADYMQKIADAVGNLKPGSTPDAQTLAKLQKLSTEIDQTKLQQASTHISAWVQKNCHG